MTDLAELALEGVPLVTNHYDKVYDPLKDKTKKGIQKVKKMRDNRGGYKSESDDYEHDGPPARRSTTAGGGTRKRSPRDDIRRRRSGRYDDSDSIVEERYAYRGPASRAQSMGRNGGRGHRQRGSRRDYSDSESSISPRPRQRRKSLGEKALVALGLAGAGGAAAGEAKSRRKSRSRRDRSLSSDYSPRRRDDRSRGAARSTRGYPDDDDRTPARYKPRGAIGNGNDSDPGSQVARRNNTTEVGPRNGGSEQGGGKKKKGSSSESSSDLCSSSEDERRTRKMKGKEYLTAGLAAVATIHAAHNVYASMEARDKRHHQVAAGEITAEQAKKQKNKAKLQDVAAIGIAALGIKGAYSEWQEVQENRHELAEQNRTRAERHEKRVKKGVGKYGSQGGGSEGGASRNRSEPPRRRDRDDRD